MQIEMWDIDRVKEYERNPRCNDVAVGAVAKSIQEFGFKVPVIVDRDGVLVAGHTRIKASRHLGMTQVPVIRVDDLTEAQVRAFRIADNQTASLASWDFTVLPLELGDLQQDGFDLDLLGFDSDQLAKLLNPDGTDGLTDPDSIPAMPDAAVTQPGDLWILGEHRLLCGDSGDPADVDNLLGGASIQLVNTDPPYNVKVEPRSNNAIAAGLSSFPASDSGASSSSQVQDTIDAPAAKLRPKDRPLAGDFVSDDAFDEMLLAWYGNIARVLEPGRSFYIWGGYSNIGNYPPVLKACGLYFSQTVIWVKEHPVLTRKDMMGNHEWAFYGWREGAGHKWFGPNNIPDVWSVKKVNPQAMVHLTEKPVELAVRSIQYSSRLGENVLDLFGGSGSTLRCVRSRSSLPVCPGMQWWT